MNALKKSRPCPQCRQVMNLAQTTLHFERGQFYADIENVRAYLCSYCGARHVPGVIALKIGAMVQDLFSRAMDAKSTGLGGHPAFTGISLHRVA